MRLFLQYLLIGLCGAALLTGLSGCLRTDEILTGSGGLRFDRDTVYFDTVFTTTGSITKRLKVYNPQANAVEISQVRVASSPSAYSVIVNGRPGNDQRNIRIAGKDSIWVLVTVRIDPRDADLPFVVADSLVFVTNGIQQDVKLRAWGQDAYFFRGRVTLSDCNARFGAARPYVITQSLTVPEGCRLTLAAGAKLYFEPGASLLVGGRLTAEGTTDQPVLLTGSRLEREYQQGIGGSWAGIVFGQNSTDNVLQGIRLRNAITGLRVGRPDQDTIADLTIRQSIIENCASTGLLAFSSDVIVENTQITNCIENTVALLAGGHYTLRHCTIAVMGCNFIRDAPHFVASNFVVLPDNTLLHEHMRLIVSNTILHGNLDEEIQLANRSGKDFEISTRNNILRTRLTNLFANNENKLGVNPRFVRACQGDYTVEATSPAIRAGADLTPAIQTDLRSRPRNSPPDIGAYERNR